MIPPDALPTHPFEVFWTSPVAEYFIFYITIEFGLHLTIISNRLIVEHRTVQLNDPAGPHNAYLVFLY
jgi:hypothetical protein